MASAPALPGVSAQIRGGERGGVTVPISGEGPGFEGQPVPMGEVPVEEDEADEIER
ncbi:MAG: hypothetical protein M3Q10_11470 [Chloroflexota bacterium]|nr:hypothetical protein [Chloroflexota bacterium]